VQLHFTLNIYLVKKIVVGVLEREERHHERVVGAFARNRGSGAAVPFEMAVPVGVGEVLVNTELFPRGEAQEKIAELAISQSRGAHSAFS